jgi:WD40 repeat protein
MFDHKRHALLSACGDVCKWCEDASSVSDDQDVRTHSRPIVGCLLSTEFEQIVTIDAMCTIKVWSYLDGKLNGSHPQPYCPGASDIAAATLDASGRRMLTNNFDNQLVLWGYNSGSVITELKLGSAKALITHMQFAHIGGRDLLVRAGWDKVIDLFMEIEQCRFEQFRVFRGHTGDISALAGFPQGLVSGTVTSEVFCWSLDTNLPTGRCFLPKGTAVECLVVVRQSVVVGDSNGNVHVLSLPRLAVVQSLPAHGITVKHSISALCADVEHNLVYSADTLGYVKMWDVGIGTVLADRGIRRCHNDEITVLILFAHNEFLATCGIDKMVRIWRPPEFQFVGFFSEESRWDLFDPETWAGQPPFETDPKHFTAQARPAVAAVSRASMPPAMALDDDQPADLPSPVALPDDRPQPRMLAYEEFDQLVNDYLARSSRQASAPVGLADKKKAEVREVEAAPTASRPLEFIDSIRKWQAHAAEEPAGRKTAVGTRGRVLRMPIKVGPQTAARTRSRGVPFLMQTTPFY